MNHQTDQSRLQRMEVEDGEISYVDVVREEKPDEIGAFIAALVQELYNNEQVLLFTIS